MGEQMDANESGAGRRSDGAYLSESEYASDSVIRPDIAWGGPEKASVAGSKLRSIGGRARRPAGAPGGRADAILIGSSAAARDMREKIALYADETAPVLVNGETGAGKELVARELHNLSERRARRFVPVNAGAIVETLAASEIFGHTKGAFTGAVMERDGAILEADGGVLFLDEIGDMPLSVQAQFLRVLDDGVVCKLGSNTGVKADFRLVSATNVDLRKTIADGAFRQDLYFRISVLVIDAPPLRERGDDMIEIAEDFIRGHPVEKYRASVLTPKAADRLRAHRFPGNVRELRNVLTRAFAHAKGGKIYAEHIIFTEFDPSGRTTPASSSARFDMSEAKELVGRFMVLKALKETNGNVKRAAEIAGRSRGTLHALVKQLEGHDLDAEYDAACAQLKALIGDC
ncbi:MAG: sigma 54-interacting transcriptional regulator [Amphiplicatus sp.]